MWGNKKPETPQAQPEIKNFPVNPPLASNPRRGYWGGNYRNEYKCYPSDGGDR